MAFEAEEDPLLAAGRAAAAAAGGAAGDGTTTSGGLAWVLKSLTPAHHKILGMVLELSGCAVDASEGEGDSGNGGAGGPDGGDDDFDDDDDDIDGRGAGARGTALPSVGFDALLEECAASLLLSKDAQLRAHLVELMDHALLAVRGNTVELRVRPKTLSRALKDA